LLCGWWRSRSIRARSASRAGPHAASAATLVSPPTAGEGSGWARRDPERVVERAHERRGFAKSGRGQRQVAVGFGPDLTWYTYIADTVRSLLSLIVASGSATADAVDVDTLAERLRAEMLAHGGVAKAPDLVSAWARKA
jgi:hypothetical protein